MAAAAGDGSASQQLVPVFEYLVLFQLKADCQPEQAVAALEALWGLQIRLPGCMCAFGGPVLQDGAFLHGTGVTHMLHMRFTSRERADAFRQHPVVREAFRTEVQPVAGELVEVLFQADIERDMDAMFRKGGEWEAGAEMLLLLRAAQPRAGSAGGAAAFAQRLAALARESRSEALQASVGPVLQHDLQSQADGSAQLALMARFPTQQQLRWFVESPPYQALLAGDSRLPASAVLAATCELLPAERQQNKAAPLHVTDR